MLSCLGDFLRNRSGSSSVELAFIGSAIGLMTLSGFNVWDSFSRDEDMRIALKTGASYYMNGGISDSTAQAQAIAAWPNAPANATVTLTRSCYCATAPLSCTSTCSSGASPSVYVTMTASGTTPTAAINPSLTESEAVRVR